MIRNFLNTGSLVADHPDNRGLRYLWVSGGSLPGQPVNGIDFGPKRRSNRFTGSPAMATAPGGQLGLTLAGSQDSTVANPSGGAGITIACWMRLTQPPGAGNKVIVGWNDHVWFGTSTGKIYFAPDYTGHVTEPVATVDRKSTV